MGKSKMKITADTNVLVNRRGRQHNANHIAGLRAQSHANAKFIRPLGGRCGLLGNPAGRPLLLPGNLCGPRGTSCDKPRASRFARDTHVLASAGPDDGSQTNGTVDRAHDRIE